MQDVYLRKHSLPSTGGLVLGVMGTSHVCAVGEETEGGIQERGMRSSLILNDAKNKKGP